MKYLAAIKYIFTRELTDEENSVSGEIQQLLGFINECFMILTRIGNDSVISDELISLKSRLLSLIPFQILIGRKKLLKGQKDELYTIGVRLRQIKYHCQRREKIMNRRVASAVAAIPQVKTISMTGAATNLSPTPNKTVLKVGKLEARIVSLEGRPIPKTLAQRLARNLELMEIMEELEMITEEDVEQISRRLDNLLERYSKSENEISPKSDSAEAIDGITMVTKETEFRELEPHSLGAIQMISRFRKYIGNPSSTRETKIGSVGDGSFWYRAINPLLNYLSNKIELRSVNPRSFSWNEIALMNKKEVSYMNKIDDLPLLLSKLLEFEDNKSLEDNLRGLAEVLSSIKGTGRFRSQNNFKILIPLIERFR